MRTHHNLACLWKRPLTPFVRGLAISLPEEDCSFDLSAFASPYFSQVLNAVDPDTWDFHYDPESQVFKLIPLPRAVHESFDWFLRDTLAYNTPWLTRDGRRHLQVSGGHGHRMTGSVPSTLANRKAQAVTKCPDSAVVFGNKRVEPLIPTVANSFSTSYQCRKHRQTRPLHHRFDPRSAPTKIPAV
ncbi:hypothetical protein BJX68DRAFT_64820 [Aspergillus pseudodeflectus]|uniref:Uncharacterized protein n=1 Tax=Aspergillus pseudodeflectus TaxID=176178 RepID=A0ABR4KM69_9EURO